MEATKYQKGKPYHLDPDSRKVTFTIDEKSFQKYFLPAIGGESNWRLGDEKLVRFLQYAKIPSDGDRFLERHPDFQIDDTVKYEKVLEAIYEAAEELGWKNESADDQWVLRQWMKRGCCIESVADMLFEMQ